MNNKKLSTLSGNQVLSVEAEANHKAGLPEFAPIRDFVKSFKIKVTVFNNNDDIIRIETMDYGIPADRIWLGRLSFWSWSQGHTVETERLTE